ncbi:hypothetical protein ACRQ1B_22075 [Rhizobium panacihumi]|uniref:hypothetical protein n=1 Tax=Rhizobium panacihumi TaxID=2008450 RepID=UPI003D7B865B
MGLSHGALDFPFGANIARLQIMTGIFVVVSATHNLLSMAMLSLVISPGRIQADLPTFFDSVSSDFPDRVPVLSELIEQHVSLRQ